IIDPETQLSERRLLQVSIIPNVETQFEEEEKVSLLQFLPENTVIWIQDEELLREQLLTSEEDLHLFFEMMKNSSKKDEAEQDDKLIKKDIKPEEFTTADDFFRDLFHKHAVYFGYEGPAHPDLPGGKATNAQPLPNQDANNNAFSLQSEVSAADHPSTGGAGGGRVVFLTK